MTHRYLSLAWQGKNAWWRYLFSILLILFFYQVIGAIPAVALITAITIDGNPNTQFNTETIQFEGVNPILSYLVLNWFLLALLVGLVLSVRFLHQRSLLSLITPYDQIDWRRMIQGFGVYFGLMIGVTLLNSLITGRGYSLTFNASQFFLFLPIALIITPIQAATEELFFRGYVMQAIALLIRHPLAALLGSSTLFMLPHLFNPEAASNLPLMAMFYWLIGLFFAVITVQDNRLELAIGAHSANNLFVALVVNYPNSALPSPSLFTANEFNASLSFVTFVGISVLFWWVLLRRRSRSEQA